MLLPTRPLVSVSRPDVEAVEVEDELPKAESGTILKARLDTEATGGCGVTGKRLWRSATGWELLSMNPGYPPIDVTHVRVEGIVVGLTRAY